MAKSRDEQEEVARTVTDIDAIAGNAEAAVMAFNDRWMPMPHFTERCEVMDQSSLRDAMGLRWTPEGGDPWPAAESLLLQLGFRWHWLGNMRVMYLAERDGYVPDTGWEDAEPVDC